MREGQATGAVTELQKVERGSPSRHQSIKHEILNTISKKLAEEGHEYAADPTFSSELLAHFDRLPTRYALDVIASRVGDVITHQQLLQRAQDPQHPLAFHVRALNSHALNGPEECTTSSPSLELEEENNIQSKKTSLRKSMCSRSTSTHVQGFQSMTLEDSIIKDVPRSKDHSSDGGGSTRYALDVNTERVEYVLTHKKMLQTAVSGNYPVCHVHPVHGRKNVIEDKNNAFQPCAEVSVYQDKLECKTAHSKLRLAFNHGNNDQEIDFGYVSSPSSPQAPMHEVTFSTVDKPKLLSQLSALLADVGLNIREAHVFSTVDGYSLDVFVVDGWQSEDSRDLQQALGEAVTRFEKGLSSQSASTFEPAPSISLRKSEVTILNPSSADWEIDYHQLKFVQKVGSGSFGDLYHGTYCGQDVAIKILKAERLNESLQREFSQEVFIMRKVRHKNVVQFIGACTKLPYLCIVTEFMSSGSMYDYLHKHKGTLRLPMVVKVAIDVSKGMDYLHQSNIVHRDLKTANLLMDENEVVKVADFGVARFQNHNGEMTAETGTYRWMAPEVIEHKPYNRKADVFSFGVVLWELLTGKLPYDYLTPIQAAVAVVQKGLRPTIPKHVPPKLAELLERCWYANPIQRPEFSEITLALQQIYKELEEDGDHDAKKREKKSGGIFSALRRSTGVH